MSMLEKFTVVDLIKTRSASVATVTGNILKFNVQTAAEMHFAPTCRFSSIPKTSSSPSAPARRTPPMRCPSPSRKVSRSIRLRSTMPRSRICSARWLDGAWRTTGTSPVSTSLTRRQSSMTPPRHFLLRRSAVAGQQSAPRKLSPLQPRSRLTTRYPGLPWQYVWSSWGS